MEENMTVSSVHLQDEPIEVSTNVATQHTLADGESRHDYSNMEVVAISSVISQPEQEVTSSVTEETIGINVESNSIRRSTNSRVARTVGKTRVHEKGEHHTMLPSFIWDYFIKDLTGKYVMCTLCPPNVTRFAYSGGTSTMNRHLRKKHQKYAPGKTSADYEYPRTSSKRNSTSSNPTALSAAVAAAAAAGGDPVAVAAALVSVLGNEQPNGSDVSETETRLVMDARNARRRATTSKRRKVLHGMLETDSYTGTAGSHGTNGEFDPSGFVTLSNGGSSGGLHFPQGFELSDMNTSTGIPGGASGGVFDYMASPVLPLTPLTRTRQQKVLTHRLLKYLIAQYEPLDVSRMGSELSTLVLGNDLYSNPSKHLVLPSEEQLKLALAHLYYSQRDILKQVIADVEVLSLSLHNWKSVFGQNVLTVSGHWISHGFSKRDCVLEVYVLPLDETVNTIALLRDVMDKWDIPASKVAALTMIKNGKEEAIHEEYPGLSLVNCFVMLLDQAVSNGLVKCTPLIQRCRNYVSYFIQNPSEYQIFLSLQRKVAEEAQSETNGKTSIDPTLSVICDFEDRWNATSEMICRIVELEQLLFVYKSNLESDTNPNRRPMQLRFVCCELSMEEWQHLKELARLLEPLEGIVHVTTHEYPSLSIIYPLIHSIQKHLQHAQEWIQMSLVASVRNTIESGLASMIQLCVTGLVPSSPYLSCLLDPRFKSLPFVETQERERLVNMLKSLHDACVDQLHSEKERKPIVKKSTQATGVTNRLLHEFFPLPNEKVTNESEKFKTHVQKYLDSPSLPATDDVENDPLEWWSRYQRTFPVLAMMAKRYLCISAVSIPFYEAFTNYGQLMKEKKARLDIEVAAQILFCRSVSRIPEMEGRKV